MDPTLLEKWLLAFVAETRKVNGDLYPPTCYFMDCIGVGSNWKVRGKGCVTVHMQNL